MPQFSLETLETLDYDFTSIPKEGGKEGEMCSGKGTIPEPTKDRLYIYAEATGELFQSEAELQIEQSLSDAELEKLGKKRMTNAQRKAAAKRRQEKFMKLTSALCANHPSVEELKELPPRALNAFLSWVYKEIADPEV